MVKNMLMWIWKNFWIFQLIQATIDKFDDESIPLGSSAYCDIVKQAVWSGMVENLAAKQSEETASIWKVKSQQNHWTSSVKLKYFSSKQLSSQTL